MSTLYELKQEYAYLLDLMDDPDMDPQTIADTMEGIEGELEVKLDNYITVRKELEAEKAKWKAEKERTDKYITSLDANISRINQAVMEAMRLTGKDKLPTEHYKLSIAKNGGLAPLKITGDVPAGFCKLEPDNSLIRKALEAGDGDIGWAHLEERGVHLNVR